MEREILNKTITDAQAVIDEAKRKMAELDKPKLRHGDYGLDVTGRPSLTIKNNANNVQRSGGDAGILEHFETADLSDRKPDRIFGNIFDDLTETLDGFEMVMPRFPDVKVGTVGTAITICQGTTISIDMKSADEFISKLQRVRNGLRK